MSEGFRELSTRVVLTSTWILGDYNSISGSWYSTAHFHLLFLLFPDIPSSFYHPFSPLPPPFSVCLVTMEVERSNTGKASRIVSSFYRCLIKLYYVFSSLSPLQFILLFSIFLPFSLFSYAHSSFFRVNHHRDNREVAFYQMILIFDCETVRAMSKQSLGGEGRERFQDSTTFSTTFSYPNPPNRIFKAPHVA